MLSDRELRLVRFELISGLSPSPSHIHSIPPFTALQVLNSYNNGAEMLFESSCEGNGRADINQSGQRPQSPLKARFAVSAGG